MTRLTPLLCALALTFTAAAHAQTQLGGHYSALALDYPDQTRHGVGAFFVYSPRDWIGADVAATIFTTEPVGGTAWQVLAGPRVGGQLAGLGVFGRVRPGFVRFSGDIYAPGIVCILIFPPPEGCLLRKTSLALDLGGTIEASLSRSTVLRLDLGDTLTRQRRRGAQAGPAESPEDSSWKHALQFVAGVGWRF